MQQNWSEGPAEAVNFSTTFPTTCPLNPAAEYDKHGIATANANREETLPTGFPQPRSPGHSFYSGRCIEAQSSRVSACCCCLPLQGRFLLSYADWLSSKRTNRVEASDVLAQRGCRTLPCCTSDETGCWGISRLRERGCGQVARR